MTAPGARDDSCLKPDNRLVRMYSEMLFWKGVYESHVDELYAYAYEHAKEYHSQTVADRAGVQLNTVYKWVERGKDRKRGQSDS